MLSIRFLFPPLETRPPAPRREGSASELRFRRQVEETMERSGSVSSASGQSAHYAIEWCEANGLTWTIRGSHKIGYYVEKGDKLP